MSLDLPTTRTAHEKNLARICALMALSISPAASIEVRGHHQSLASVGPVVLAANHRSMADFAVGLTVMGRLGVLPGILMARRFLPGPLGWLADQAGIIPVGRGGAVAAGVTALKSGRSLVVMPEGRLHWNPTDPTRLGRIRPGMTRMARLAGRPIVPVAVDGTERVWPKDSVPRVNPMRRKKVVVTIGEPIPTTDEDDQAQAERVMNWVRRTLIPR